MNRYSSGHGRVADPQRNNSSRFGSRRVVGSALVALGLAISSPAVGAGEILAIPAAAFMDDEADREFTGQTLLYTENGTLFPQIGFSPCADAPLMLPHGAEILSLAAWANDGSVVDDLYVDLMRKPIGTAAAPTVVENVGTSGSAGVWALPKKIFSHFVDRASFVYALRVCMPTFSFNGVVIEYVGPGAGANDARSPVSVHPSAFRETQGLNEARHDHPDGFVHSIWSTEEDTRDLVAPLQLPAGATIHRLAATVANPGSDAFSVRLMRKRINNASAGVALAEVTTTAGNATVETKDADLGGGVTVDAAYHHYLVMAGLDGTDGQRLYDVVIEHDDPIFDDGFENGSSSRWSVPGPGAAASMLLSSAAFRGHWSAWDTRTPPSDPVATYDPDEGMIRLQKNSEDSGAFCVIAPVVLPQGAHLVAWAVAGLDTDASRDMTVRLLEKGAADGASVPWTELGTLSSNGSPGPWFLFAELDHQVENLAHNLTVEWCQVDQDAEAGDFGLISVELFFRTMAP